MTDHCAGPVGAVLAGGRGRRLGGVKATIGLSGRALIEYPLAALQAVLAEVVVVAKPDTELPELAVPVWREAGAQRHPAVGIVEALRRAGGRPVLVVGCDYPLLDRSLVAALARCDPGGAAAVVATVKDELQPLLCCYHPAALPLLDQAAEEGSARLRELLAGWPLRRVEVEDRDTILNVNTPADLARAEELLASRGYPNVKS